MAVLFQSLYILGQILDVIGAYMLFKYGISPHIQKYPQQIRLTEAGEKFMKEDIAKFEKKAKTGFILIGVGFALQFFQSIFTLLKLI